MKELFERIPESCKVLALAGSFFGISLADAKDLIQIGVGLVTITYILTKTVKIWTKKRKEP